MGKENSILTVDVGSRSLKMAEFSFQNGGMTLVNFLSRRMELAEGETGIQWFERNYTEMLIEGRFVSRGVRLALSSGNSFQRLSKLPPMIGNSAAVDRLIEFEASQAVPYAMHEVEWGYQLLRHEWDETKEEQDEEGNTQEVTVHNDEYEALFVAMKTEEVVRYTDIIEKYGKKVLSVELSPLNLFNAAVVSQINDDESVLLLEIGAKGSCLMIADHCRIFMRNIPIGGDTLNAQISREFGVGDREAEEMKRRYGFVALGGAYDEPDSELAATISKIARNVMTRLHGEVSRSINVWRAQHGGNPPTRMLLAGGGSTMQYTTEFFNEKLRMPVSYLNTFGLITIGDAVDRNALQASASMAQSMIGMALHNLGSCPVDISLLPRKIRRQYELDARKPYFYASAIALLSCLLISLLCIFHVYIFEKERVSRVEQGLVKAENESKQIKELKSKLDGMIGRYEETDQFLNARKRCTAVLGVLQEIIPDRMWLVALEPLVQNEADAMAAEMGMGGGTGKPDENDPSRHLTPQQYSNVREVKVLRMVGYIASIDKIDAGRNIFTEFEDKLREKSDVFEKVEIKEKTDGGNSNLSYFVVDLTLKEALKK